MIFLRRISAYADDGADLGENINSIIDSLDLSGIQNYLDRYGNDLIFSYGKTAKEVVTYLIEGNLNVDYGQYIGGLLSSLFNGVTSLMPAFAQIIAITVLCAISSGVEGGLIGKTTAKAIRLACMSLIMLILSATLLGVISDAITCLTNIKKQVELFTPILVTLTVLTGGSGAGAIYQPSAVFIGNAAIELVSGLIFPVTIAVIVLNFTSRLNPDISFTGVSALLKSVMKWVIGITVAIFGLFITMQSSASSLFNGIFFKVTKYLVGNSVPLVGNFLSSGVDMVVMSGSIVKSSLGLMGILILLGEIISPIIMLAAFSITLKICGAIAQPLGEKDMYKLFTDLSKDSEFFIAGIFMVSFMYLLIIMLIINSAYGFV